MVAGTSNERGVIAAGEKNSTQPLATDCYCTQFRRTSGALTRIYDESLKPAGLRITQFSLLRALGRLGSATLTELAEESALDLTTISRNISLLRDLGWVASRPGKQDRREKVLQLSDAGRNAVKRAMPEFRKAQRRVDRHIREAMQQPGEAKLLATLLALQRAGREA